MSFNDDLRALAYLRERHARPKRERYIADLWSAVWEASQLLSPDETREVVEDVLREIKADEE